MLSLNNFYNKCLLAVSCSFLLCVVVPNAVNAEDVLRPDLEGFKTLRGTNGGDILHGTNGPDLIHTMNGADVVFAGDGDDRINWGRYNEKGTKAFFGGKGNDSINGGQDSDTIEGGQGNDSLSGHGGNDIVRGGLGHDTLHGEAGNDTLFGEDGNDLLFGHIGQDWLYGGAGDDRLYGYHVRTVEDLKRLYGRQMPQSKYLDGGEGNDHLYGGLTSDHLIGGKGKDFFHATSSDHSDVISDFSFDDQDVINITTIIEYSSEIEGADITNYVDVKADEDSGVSEIYVRPDGNPKGRWLKVFEVNGLTLATTPLQELIKNKYIIVEDMAEKIMKQAP